MVLEIKNKAHPQASSEWVAATAEAPWPRGTKLISMRDTTLAVDAGTADLAAFRVPEGTWKVRCGVFGFGGGGSAPAGTGRFLWTPEGGAAASTDPAPANDDSGGVEFSFDFTADLNEYGVLVADIPEWLHVRFTGITNAPTTLDVRLELRLLEAL